MEGVWAGASAHLSPALPASRPLLRQGTACILHLGDHALHPNVASVALDTRGHFLSPAPRVQLARAAYLLRWMLPWRRSWRIPG